MGHLDTGPGAAPGTPVLVVDDEGSIRELMSRWLESGGYKVSRAAGADEALSAMEAGAPAVALCDILMPGRDGLWLARRIRQEYPETAVIMASAVAEYSSEAARLGDCVVDYLTKPLDRARLRAAVVRGVRWHRSALEARTWRERLEREVETRRCKLGAAIGAVPIESDDAVDDVLSVLLLDDPDAHAHARRVARLAGAVADAMGLSAEAVGLVRRAALLHDLGKLAIPETLLKKPAPLTAEEERIVRRYPEIGADLLAGLPFLETAADVVRRAQERGDGEGYPHGLTAADLPVAARIVAVADAFDTMTRPRVFRDARGRRDALAELERCAGTQFDPVVVRTLTNLIAVH
jgi:response regulator RpfG family c-di-GMP phosphodiesterase